MQRDERYQRIWSIVRMIPRGRVATYGQIAALAGMPRHARQVGYALRALPDGSDVPWHRVISSSGRISRRRHSDSDELQRLLLEAEGVTFDDSDRIDLEACRWEPEDGPGRPDLISPSN